MKSTSKQKCAKGAPGTRAALRALRRVARKVHAENRKLGLPVILWQDGKVVERPASTPNTSATPPPKQGVAEEAALNQAIKETSKKFVEIGAEVYAKV